MDGAAGPAAIAWTANTDDPKPCRHIVEHLAYGVADWMEGTAN